MQDLRAAIRNLPPAEHACDWDPIHMPGTVQPYGVLLVADPGTRRVLYVSNNAAEMFGVPVSEILNKSYIALADHERERRVLADRIAADTILFPNPLRMTIKGREYDAVFVAHGNQHHIELEPVRDGASDYDQMALKAAAELYDPPSVDELYQRAVRKIREVSGFDRVMLYRFDSRHNGQVIAEATKEGIGSFMGMFFPSGDIPARARQLYQQNFTRYIPDIGAKWVGVSSVFPGDGKADSGHPLDMSSVNLRSIAPPHITYLQNIGIGASMSFSINVDGRLWGLFACHHYSPKYVSYDERVVCEQTAMMFIYRLAVMSSASARLSRRQEDLALLGQQLHVGSTLRRRLVSMAGEWHGSPGSDTAQTMLARAVHAVEAQTCFLLADAPPKSSGDAGPLTEAQSLLLNLVEADSAAIVRNGRVIRIGDAPDEMAVYAIASMFGRELPDLREGNLHVFATDCLTKHAPVTGAVKDRAAGILAVALSTEQPEYLIWFRREQIVQATWAGNPSADALSAGAEGLNPRASFDAWKQDIRDLSRSWVIEDVQIADQLAAVMRGLSSDAAPVPYGLSHTESNVRPLIPTATPHLAAHAGTHGGSSQVAPPRRVIRIGQR
jgi:light-regulated signal transduction histidine kinase (bacteriophytochrome)